MKKIIYITLLFTVQLYAAQAQDERYSNSNLKQKIESLKKAGEIFHPLQLLRYKGSSFVQGTANYLIYEMDDSKLKEAFRANYTSINFILPVDNGNQVEIYLTRNQIFADDFEESVTDAEGLRKIADNDRGNLYHGIINDAGKISLACVSIFENEMAAIICDETGNWNLGPLKGGSKNEYAYFNDRNFHLPEPFTCATLPPAKSIGQNPESGSKLLPTNCVRVFIDCDLTLYTFLGSTTAAVKTYVQNIFNVSSTLYGLEDISVTISSIHYWTTSDPFPGNTSTDALNSFQAYYTFQPYNGDIACLLAVDAGAQGGLAAGVGHFNDNSSFCYCDLYAGEPASMFVFPTYTWDVNVFTHELGHLFGSAHTHDCVWNGNNTAIDGCGPTAGYPGTGFCPLGPIPGVKQGTIMSYCHLLQAVEIGFIHGFGSQPGTAIRAFTYLAGSLTSCNSYCQPYVSVGFPVVSGNNYTYEAQQITYGSNDIESGGTANFQAGTLVRLNPGFHAFNGSTFHAYIASCSPAPKLENNFTSANKEADGFFKVQPNPLSTTANISFVMTKSENASIKIFDVNGKLITTLADKNFNAGENHITWDASDLHEGIYVLQFQSAEIVKTEKLIVTK